MPDDILLDTHVVLWWHGDPGRLSEGAQAAIDAAARVLVSPITCWEVAMLVDKGRIALDRPVERWVDDLLAGVVDLAPLTARAAIRAGALDGFHGDPADRLIYATAAEDRLALVTRTVGSARAAATGDVRIVW